MVDYDDGIKVQLKGVYDGGVVYEITCISDVASNRYNTITKGLLIVRNDEVIKFIINGVDNRVNHVNPSDKWLASCNEDEVTMELASIGKRVDTPLVDTRENIFKRMHGKKIRELTNEKVQLLIKKSILIMEKSLYDLKDEKEENRKK